MFYQSTKSLFVPILFLLIIGCAESKKNTIYQTLWYDEAATVWEEALPLGNGRLGVMVFGDPKSDRIQLNDDSLWPHDLRWEHPPGGPEELKSVREILLQGDARSADSLMVHYFSNKSITRSHQTLGDLYLNLKRIIINSKTKSNLKKEIVFFLVIHQSVISVYPYTYRKQRCFINQVQAVVDEKF